jgi:murein DD-endopeptidase MepM/ murein hydrolase activator NlpD
MAKLLSGLLIGVVAAPGLSFGQAATKGPAVPPATPIIDELKAKALLLPVPGVDPAAIKDTFREPRGPARVHHAIDIVAPRGTPVLSTDSGQIIKLYTSQAGGLMIYAVDTSRRFIYYYAHLDRYRTGIAEGQWVARGDTIGYVGTSGNAPPDFPHLHFAILRSYDVSKWSRGLPVNPAKVF